MTYSQAIAILLLTAAATAPVRAQTERTGGGEVQRFMQQYQQIAAEKVALQAQVTELKGALDAANKQLSAAQKERDALKSHAAGAEVASARLARESAAKEAADKALDQYKQRLNELIGRFRDTVGTLKGVEDDRAQLRKTVEELNAAYDNCAEDNLQLYEISTDVLNRYDHVGFFTRVGAAEPFTKITRTRIENLVDEYRQKALELRLKKASP